jgi:hypothetical protein
MGDAATMVYRRRRLFGGATNKLSVKQIRFSALRTVRGCPAKCPPSRLRIIEARSYRRRNAY